MFKYDQRYPPLPLCNLDFIRSHSWLDFPNTHFINDSKEEIWGWFILSSLSAFPFPHAASVRCHPSHESWWTVGFAGKYLRHTDSCTKLILFTGLCSSQNKQPAHWKVIHSEEAGSCVLHMKHWSTRSVGLLAKYTSFPTQEHFFTWLLILLSVGIVEEGGHCLTLKSKVPNWTLLHIFAQSPTLSEKKVLSGI